MRTIELPSHRLAFRVVSVLPCAGGDKCLAAGSVRAGQATAGLQLYRVVSRPPALDGQTAKSERGGSDPAMCSGSLVTLRGGRTGQPLLRQVFKSALCLLLYSRGDVSRF